MERVRILRLSWPRSPWSFCCRGVGEGGVRAPAPPRPKAPRPTPPRPQPRRSARRNRCSSTSPTTLGVGPANVPIPMADKKGYFKKLGLQLGAGSPLPPSRPVVYISKDTNDFGVTQMPQLLIALEKGAPIMAVGSLVPQPTAAMIWLKKSGIRRNRRSEGEDDRNSWHSLPGSVLETVFARAGSTLEDVTVKGSSTNWCPPYQRKGGCHLRGLLEHRGSRAEGRRAEPVIKRVQELGIPAYDELIVIVGPIERQGNRNWSAISCRPWSAAPPR